jgi:dCTP deaminase
MLIWKQILQNVADGYAVTQNVTTDLITNKLANPKFTLKEASEDKELKKFFKTNKVSEDTIDEFIANAKSPTPIIIDDFDPSCLRPANYDLRLGEEVYVTTDKLPVRLSSTNDTIAIQPGEFGILMTHEYIHVPTNFVGLISLRFSFKKEGLINISGFHVDPGFTGRIIFSVFNTGPRSVVLRLKDPVFMIMFEQLNDAATAYAGVFKQQRHIPIDIVTSLAGQSVNVVSLDGRVKSLENTLRILEGILIALVGVALTYGLGKLIHLIP